MEIPLNRAPEHLSGYTHAIVWLRDGSELVEEAHNITSEVLSSAIGGYLIIDYENRIAAFKVEDGKLIVEAPEEEPVRVIRDQWVRKDVKFQDERIPAPVR